MSSDLLALPLEELTDGTTITYGVVKPGDECPRGIRFIRGGDVVAGSIRSEQLRTITPEVSNQYSRTLLKGGELLVSLVGNPGKSPLSPTFSQVRILLVRLDWLELILLKRMQTMSNIFLDQRLAEICCWLIPKARFSKSLI